MYLRKWDKEKEDYEDRSVYRRYEDEEDGYRGYDDDEDDEDYFDGWGGDSSKYHWPKGKRDD